MSIVCNGLYGNCLQHHKLKSMEIYACMYTCMREWELLYWIRECFYIIEFFKWDLHIHGTPYSLKSNLVCLYSIRTHIWSTGIREHIFFLFVSIRTKLWLNPKGFHVSFTLKTEDSCCCLRGRYHVNFALSFTQLLMKKQVFCSSTWGLIIHCPGRN